MFLPVCSTSSCLGLKSKQNHSPPEEQIRCLSGLAEALHVKNSSLCWENESWTCNLSWGGFQHISVHEARWLYLCWVWLELSGKSPVPGTPGLPTCHSGGLLLVSLKVSARKMTPLVTAQSSPQEMPLEVTEPAPSQPKLPLPSWLIQYVFDLGVSAGNTEQRSSSISVLHWFS